MPEGPTNVNTRTYAFMLGSPPDFGLTAKGQVAVFQPHTSEAVEANPKR